MKETPSAINDDGTENDLRIDCNEINNSTNTVSLAMQRKKLELHFHNVSYALKLRNDKTIKILNETCGTIKSGHLTAILGPSGAGKTSMLNVLAGFKAKGVTGHIKLNDQERDLTAFRKISSYIPQDFVMLDLLTVEETLKVSSYLKLPNEMPKQDKQKIINEIIEVLNMEKCRSTLVRSLSGGEKKRLSIGIELVTNPPIMFFDEPTSGLDSVASLNVIEYLRRLATAGRIIACVVHQPSSRLMKLFDDVLIMSHGEVLYAGPQTAMLDFFQQSGYMCPNYYNPADFVLEVGSEEQNKNFDELVQRNKDLHYRATTKETFDIDEQTELLSQDGHQMTIDLADKQKSDQENVDIRPKECVPFWTQFTVLLWRHFLSTSRNLMAIRLRFIVHAIVGILLGIVYWQIGNDGSKVLSNCSCILFMVLFLFCGNAMPSILICQQDPAVFIREYLNGWYSVNTYYLSKIIADLPMQLLCPSVFIVSAYFMTGQPTDWNRFVMCWLICLLTAVIGHTLGLTSGSFFDLHLSVFIVPATAIPFLLFSGFFIRMNELSWFLRPICDVSYFRYVLEGFLRAIYGYDRPTLECREDFCYYKSPQKLLKDFDMTGDNFSFDIFVICIFIALLDAVFYISLHVRVRRAL